MGNIHKPSDNIRTDVAMIIATLNNSFNAEIYFSMANYDLAWFLVTTGARGGGTASLTCQMRQRVGAAGAQANLKAAATVITANGVDGTLFARGEDLTATYTHVGILITETATQNFPVASVLLRMRARYKQATMIV